MPRRLHTETRCEFTSTDRKREIPLPKCGRQSADRSRNSVTSSAGNADTAGVVEVSNHRQQNHRSQNHRAETGLGDQRELNRTPNKWTIYKEKKKQANRQYQRNCFDSIDLNGSRQHLLLHTGVRKLFTNNDETISILHLYTVDCSNVISTKMFPQIVHRLQFQ
jgi:hypothetical protein